MFITIRVKNRPPKEGNYFNLEFQGGSLWISLKDVERRCRLLVESLNGVPLGIPAPAPPPDGPSKRSRKGGRGERASESSFRRKLAFGDVITITVGGAGVKGVCDLLFKAAPGPKPKPDPPGKEDHDGNGKKQTERKGQWPPKRDIFEDEGRRDYIHDVAEDYERSVGMDFHLGDF